MIGEPGSTVQVEARAKLNPFLRVLGRRDDGYHELETLVVPLGLADSVRITARNDPASFDALTLRLDVAGEPAIVEGVPVDGTNLALRAASELAEEVRPLGFAEIVVEKRIPPGGGLGGGSADAAAVLLALNDLWDARLGVERLRGIGARIGSDVPALLTGAPVVATGRGEHVTPVPAAAFDWLVVTFGSGVSTKAAFGWWDADGAITGPDPEAVLRAMADGDPIGLGPLLFNDLEAPVLRRRPDIAAAKAALLDAGLPGAVLCGSGASLAGLFPTGADPDAFAEPVASLRGIAGRPPVFIRSVGTASA